MAQPGEREAVNVEVALPGLQSLWGALHRPRMSLGRKTQFHREMVEIPQHPVRFIFSQCHLEWPLWLLNKC